MGHKVPPLANRLGINRTWNSRWFAKRQNFGLLLLEDAKIREHIRKNLNNAAIARIEIERTPSRIRVIIHSARPGIVIGRRGADIDRLRDDLHSVTQREVTVDIAEIKNPATDAQLVSENIAFQLERQVSFRRAMKRAVQLAMSGGALGIKVRSGGRLGGAEMSRVESYKEGKVPLGTFRAEIDFGFSEAKTTYGRIGVKCWIYKGDSVIRQKKGAAAGEEETAQAAPSPANEGAAASAPPT